MKSIVRIFFIGLISSCTTEQLIHGRPGPGSGDYPAESTGFAKDEEWEIGNNLENGVDLDNRTFLNKWRTEQQKKSNSTVTKQQVSESTRKKALRDQLLKDFERYLNVIESSNSSTEPTNAPNKSKNKRTPLHGSIESVGPAKKMHQTSAVAVISPNASSNKIDKVVEIKTANQNENVVRGVIDETEEGSREL